MEINASSFLNNVCIYKYTHTLISQIYLCVKHIYICCRRVYHNNAVAQQTHSRRIPNIYAVRHSVLYHHQDVCAHECVRATQQATPTRAHLSKHIPNYNDVYLQIMIIYMCIYNISLFHLLTWLLLFWFRLLSLSVALWFSGSPLSLCLLDRLLHFALMSNLLWFPSSSMQSKHIDFDHLYAKSSSPAWNSPWPSASTAYADFGGSSTSCSISASEN